MDLGASRLHPDEAYERAFVNGWVPPATVSITAAAAAAERTYRLSDCDPAIKSLGDIVATRHQGDLPVILVPGSSLMDVVAGGDTRLSDTCKILEPLEHEGWTIILLVPLARTGEAHAACRDTAVSWIQSYWLHQGEVAFGRKELP
jgi:hypothetical protein